MPRWLVVAVALILYAAGMAVVLYVANLLIPPLQVWLYAKVGAGGTWALFIALLVGSGILALYLHRADGRAAGKAGRSRSP